MFLFDDILLSPVKGFLFIAERVRDAAVESQEAEAGAITKELSSLYTKLESGEITEEEFDEIEERLLDRLEALRGDDDNEDDEDDDAPSFSVTTLDAFEDDDEDTDRENAA